MTRVATWCEHIPSATQGASADATTAINEETLYSVQDTSVDTTTIYNGPALLMGVYVNTVLSAHTVILKDNATSVITLPASLAAGTNLKFPGIRFETSLVIDPDNSSTGNVTVFYRPI